jgi:hypothetical protein
LRNTAHFLSSWSARFIENIKVQLEAAKEVVFQLEVAQDQRSLSDSEESLRKLLKMKCLGLSLLQRNIAWQESRLLWLGEGDAPTKFFHMHANLRRRRKHIWSLKQGDQVVFDEDEKAVVAFNYFDDLLGTTLAHVNAINLNLLNLGTIDPSGLTERFSEAEVWATISALPPNKELGPDGFMALFLQAM